jgi:hypothetical protein
LIEAAEKSDQLDPTLLDRIEKLLAISHVPVSRVVTMPGSGTVIGNDLTRFTVS